MNKFNVWFSERGVKYILSPKRDGRCVVNPEIASTIMAGTANKWNGSFISPDCETISLDSSGMTKIIMPNGSAFYYDGTYFYEGDV